MNEIEQKIEELKACIGKTDSESHKKFEEALVYLRENDSEEVQRMLSDLLSVGLAEVEQEVRTLKRQIGEVYDLIPLSYIAGKYFGKTRSWLYQRLNGYQVRGKVYSLNEKEKEIFNKAMQDLAERFASVRLS